MPWWIKLPLLSILALTGLVVISGLPPILRTQVCALGIVGAVVLTIIWGVLRARRR